MLEIKTITENYPHLLDRAVNDALKDGWELVRRECFITGPDRAATFYAELERVVEEPYEDEGDDDHSTETAKWEIIREPRNPYRCSACGHRTNAMWPTCPQCDRIMRD